MNKYAKRDLFWAVLSILIFFALPVEWSCLRSIALASFIGNTVILYINEIWEP